MSDMHDCMSKLNMHVCMFRFAWGLTRLARRARGGLFALRVTRRGYLEALRLGGEEVERITCRSQVQQKFGAKKSKKRGLRDSNLGKVGRAGATGKGRAEVILRICAKKSKKEV